MVPAFNYLLPFDRWYSQFTPVIPQFYWDVISAEQRMKEICCRLHKLIEYCDKINDNTKGFDERIIALEKEFEKFIESGFYDYYAELLEKWVDDNMPSIISRAIKMVFFGLTDDGYFTAYIPDSWNEIEFDTGATYGTDTYGRLILRYDV